MSETGSRVRTCERLREIEQDKAEAKFEGEVREGKRLLVQAAKDKKEMEETADFGLRQQAMESRRAEKDLTTGHKRQLEEMRGDLERKIESELKSREDAYRQGRQKTNKRRSGQRL